MIIYHPFDCLTIVFLILFDIFSFRVNVKAFVDCADEVVYYLHQELGVFAQPEPLHGLRVDVPIEVF